MIEWDDLIAVHSVPEHPKISFKPLIFKGFLFLTSHKVSWSPAFFVGMDVRLKEDILGVSYTWKF